MLVTSPRTLTPAGTWFPRDDGFGKPCADGTVTFWRTVTIQVGTPFQILPRPERTAIVFWASDNDVTLSLGTGSEASGPMAVSKSSTIWPVVIDADKLGDLARIGFTVNSTIGSAQFTYVEVWRPACVPSRYEAMMLGFADRPPIRRR